MRPIHLVAITLGVIVGTLATTLLPGLGASSLAGTALRMDLEESFQRSDLVVEGTVVGATCGEDESGTIFTDWELAIDRTFWGDHEPTRRIRIPGGILESGRGMVIPGLPGLALGEDVVLLLGQAAPNGMRVPTGLSQGKYRIVTAADGTRTALQAGDHVTLVTPETTAAARGLNLLDHAELVARLEAARQARRALAGFGQEPASVEANGDGR